MNSELLKYQSFSVVWFKRDLRLRDHEPLCNAIQLGQPVVLAYIVEPFMLENEHMDIRHWRFIIQSLQNMNDQLKDLNCRVILVKEASHKWFEQLADFGLTHIFSHQEVGLSDSYERDKKVKKVCQQRNLIWHESTNNAVQRPLPNRINWKKHWNSRIFSNTQDADVEKLSKLSISHELLSKLPDQIQFHELPATWIAHDTHFQKGGEKLAWYTLHDFFKDRGRLYFGNIGKPERSRQTCSRLSPYLAWGNISIKQVYKVARQNANREGWSRSVEAFCSRLNWHCHFIQKFESEHMIEFRPVNRAYSNFPYDTSPESESLLKAWKLGRTGIPIVDASMRALIKTGYLNFRMRAMLVSFLCHHLNIDWRRGVAHLGKQFLDFEPGIHYPQFQMQAGITGTNTIRIYNPVKQSEEKDPNGNFIKKWLPELSDVPSEYIHQVHLIPPFEAQMINFDLHRDYYPPIIDVTERAKQARDRLWSFRKREDVNIEAKRILSKHIVPNVRRMS